jgi:hypothetical protein
MTSVLSRIALGVSTALALFSLAGCESTPKPYEEKWSNIPQNRPQAWEGSAAMGAFMPGSN